MLLDLVQVTLANLMSVDLGLHTEESLSQFEARVTAHLCPCECRDGART